MHEVVIVGGGPTGMVLAAELALARIDVLVLERRETAELVGSRAGGFHARTLEIFDQRGIVDRFLSEGTIAQATRFGDTTLDMSDFPSRYPHSLGLWQSHIERILLGWVHELGVPIRRGVEVLGMSQDENGVTLQIADGSETHAGYVVAADGGRSALRKAAGIDFVGDDATRSNLIAEVEVTEALPTGPLFDAKGVHGLQLMPDGRTVRVIVTEATIGPASDPSLEDLSRALTYVFGTDFGVHDPTWISRFTDATRQAAAYRAGRVLIAGDAAHIHSPAGGQGIGLGVQDAVNLGWKLAQVMQGVSDPALLDTYFAERHPVTARTLRHTMVQSSVQRADPRTDAVRDTISELLAFDEPRKAFTGLLSGLDVAYDLGAGHPLLGRRMPDLDLTTAEGPMRVFALLRSARPLLLNLGVPGTITAGPWSARVPLLDASYDGEWELPVIGIVPAPTAVLVRPDGHVAWVGQGARDGLEEALTTWFGRAQRPVQAGTHSSLDGRPA